MQDGSLAPCFSSGILCWGLLPADIIAVFCRMLFLYAWVLLSVGPAECEAFFRKAVTQSLAQAM